MIKLILKKIFCFIKIHKTFDSITAIIEFSRYKELNESLSRDLKVINQGVGRVEICGNVSKFKIDPTSHLKSNTFIECSGGVTIGKFVHTARGLTIFSVKHNWKNSSKIPYCDEIINGPVEISDCVWIGANVTILPGTIIHEGAIIGAGSVVRGEIPKCAIVVGNPCEVTGYRDIDHFHKCFINECFN